MKAFRIIVIWVCITAIKEKNLLAKATWSLPAAPKLPTKKAEEQTKPVVLVPVDQNTTADRSNEVDWKSIPHPEHKTKRCKSLTPLRKVRLSAPLKKVNNDETESQSGSAMNKIEVAFPSSKMKNTTPKPEYLPTSTFDDPSDSTSLPRFVKHIDENDENALDYSYHTRDLEEAWARGRGREPFTGQEKKKKYLCYCLDEECARRDPLKSLYSGRNRPAPKLLQNTDLYSQIEALAAANSEEDRGEEYRGLPLIYRKQGSRRPADKRLKSKKCTPVLVACEPTDKPTKISLPLRMQTNRGSPRPPARPFRPVESNYQRFSAEGAPNVPYGPPYDVYQLPSPRLSSLQGIPELPHLGSAYAGVEVSCSNPAFSSLEECVKFCGRDVCYAAMNYGYSGYYPQHDNYQPPMIGSPHAEYGYDNYPGNYAPTGVLDSSTDYIVRLPDDEGNSGGEEAQAGRGNQQYPDLAEGETFVGSSSDCSAPPQIESEIESYDVAEGDLPGLGRPHNVVQPGFTHESQVKLVNIPREDHNVIVQPGFTHESQVKPLEIPREDHNVIVQPGFTHESQVKLVGIPREDHNVIVQPGFTHESQVKLVGIPREDHNVIIQPGFTHESQVKPLESPRKDHNVIVQPGFTHAFNDDNSAEGEATVAHSESTEDCAESPEPETYEAIETPLHAAHQDNPEDVDEENCTYPEEPTEGYRVPGVYPDPGNYGSQFDTTLPSPTPWNFYEGDSPKASIIGKSYGPSESAVDNNNYQKAEAPVGPQQSEFPDCPQAEPVSASADQHLHDLEALTGLSIEDSKLLRGAIYESINRVASSAKQEIESNKVSSSCDIIGAPEPAKIPGLGDNSLLRNLLHTSEVRNLVLGTIKALIPQVTGTSRDSGLGKLADNIINRSLSVVLGEDDLPEDSGEPSLGLVNENVGSMPDQIMRILSSLINQPGVGLENARLPGIQNIIVRTLGEILRRGKNVVDNAVIWEALNDVLNPEEGPVVAPKTPRPTQPELPKPLLPRARVHDDKVIMKPLGYFPVTEHYIKKGQWYESSATIGYKGEFPGDFPDAVRPADSENAVAPQDYSHLGSPKDADCVTEEANTPIKYQSPQNIVLEYIKNHPAGEANLGAAISGDDDADDCASEEPIIGDQLESYDDRSPHDFTGSGGKEPEGSAGSPVSNPTYFGRITSPNAGGISGIGDLEGSELLYIGDGVKLPLSIKRMEDGSLALMLSEKICRSFVQKNCPCCLPQQGGQVRYSRRAGEKGNTRGIRSSTINSDEADDSPSSGEDAGAVAVMPVEKFVEKYNLTLNLGDNGEINSWRDKSGKLERRGTESMVNYVEDGREREDSEDSGENDEDVSVILSPSDRDEYIQELLAMQNAPVNDRAAIVINALDDLLNFSAEGGAGEEGQSADGFEYQKDNPFMKRVENIKEGQSGHGGYKYQRNLEDTARVRMEVAKDVLHWLKELIVKSKTSGMG